MRPQESPKIISGGQAGADCAALNWAIERGFDYGSSRSPATSPFRDGAFENDAARTNLAAILNQHGIRHVRSL